jgi:hypothetical protein
MKKVGAIWDISINPAGMEIINWFSEVKDEFGQAVNGKSYCFVPFCCLSSKR